MTQLLLVVYEKLFPQTNYIINLTGKRFQWSLSTCKCSKTKTMYKSVLKAKLQRAVNLDTGHTRSHLYTISQGATVPGPVTLVTIWLSGVGGKFLEKKNDG